MTDKILDSEHGVWPNDSYWVTVGFSDRFKYALHHYFLNETASDPHVLAEWFGAPLEDVQAWLKDELVPDEKTIAKLAAYLHFSGAWLAAGTGPPRV